MSPHKSDSHSADPSTGSTQRAGTAPIRPQGTSFWVGASVLTAMLVVAFPCSGGGGKKKKSDETTGGDGGALPVVEDAYGAIKASNDLALQSQTASDAMTIDALGGAFEFVDGGWYVEFHSGGGRLTGAMRSTSDPDLELMLDADFDLPVEAGAVGTLTEGPVLELDDGSYVADGGTIDPASWFRWESFSGTLDGRGLYRGLQYQIELARYPVQIGAGANGRNGSHGLYAHFSGTRVQDAPGAPALPLTFESGHLRIDLKPSTLFCAAGDGSGRALTIDGIDDEFLIVSRASFLERLDGSAVLRATIVPRSHPDRGFALTLSLDGRVSGGASYPPEGSPVLERADVDYVGSGGDIDPATWRYYRGAGGTLEGLGVWEGARLNLELDGPPAQIGFGANAEVSGNGLHCQYTVDVADLPTEDPLFPVQLGAASLHLALPLHCGSCPGGGCAIFTAKASPDEYARTGDDWGLSLPGVGTFELAAGGTFTAQLDGSARWTALFSDPADPARRFWLDMLLGDRSAPGDDRNGISPHLDLDPSAYASNGGPVDPAQWTHWRVADAVLTGLEDFDGAVYFLELEVPSFQLGSGASARNIGPGLWGRYRAELQSQVSSGSPLPALIEGTEISLASIEELDSCVDGSLPDAGTGIARGKSLLSLGGIGATFLQQGQVTMHETDDGRAKLIATFVDSQDSNRRFTGRIDLAGRVDPGTLGHPPTSSPVLALPSDSYVESGGPIDASGWCYFGELFGTLNGEGDFAGARLQISRQGPAFQLGLGATGENHLFGGSGGFLIEVLSQPDAGAPFPETAVEGSLQLVLDQLCR